MYLFPSENLFGHNHERRSLPETTLCVLNTSLARLSELCSPQKEEAHSGRNAELTLLMMISLALERQVELQKRTSSTRTAEVTRSSREWAVTHLQQIGLEGRISEVAWTTCPVPQSSV